MGYEIRQHAEHVAVQEIGGTAVDAFSRLRVSEPQAVFDCQFTYNAQPLLFEQITAESGAAVAHEATERAIKCTFADTPTGGKAYVQSYRYFRYQPGKSQTVFITFNMNSGVANVVKLAGLTDGTNGYEFRLNGTTPEFRIVSATTAGTQTAGQTAWNIDAMDGSGPSGITLDFSKTQILVINFQALYVGRVIFGWDVGGKIVAAHEFNNANVQAYPYIQTANLPIRVGMTCTGTVSTTMLFDCCAVISEGGQSDTTGFLFTAEGTATAGSATRTHILSIQPATTFNSITNRIQIEPLSVELLVTGSNPIYWELCLGATFSGTPTWTSVNATYSGMKYNSAGTISGTPAIILASGYVNSTAASRGSGKAEINSLYPITLDAAGAVRTLGTLTLCVTGIGSTSATRAALNWKEVR